ncbi:hypothetical protein [Spartinivicinus poritis]|uniref:Uncharacterized protein n=1 Tax=Spartinivicinus poritis TaxID=2994640 RepID=A0ABT5UDW5_9GAMM|nr:hypothetical protein [Spartinivicinus sp. A2-2]MDE1463289.1 hypothetical protein [Spartinivicinus sp. A2-2]
MINFNHIKFVIYQLTRPFSYLSIKHEDKWYYDWLTPLVLTILTLAVSVFYIPIQSITGSEGLVSDITSFISNLPGFFIAALAAVATFNKHDIDQPMANPPKIEIFYHGSYLMIDMTRRRFLCVLFSYLTAVSIFLILGAKIALKIEISEQFKIPLSWVGFGIFNFLLWQMVLATILGLYYLGERLHTPQ